MAIDKAVDSTALDDGLSEIADAIRGKTGKSNAIAFPNGFVDEVETLQSPEGAWVKPDDWPDIESLPLPGTDTSCMYFLYDCTTNVRYAGFTHTNSLADLSIAKYQNGVLGEFSNADKIIINGEQTAIPLPDDCQYAVLRLDGEYRRWTFARYTQYGLDYWQNNIESNQPCLWCYGKVFSNENSDLYVNNSAGISAINMQRARLFLSPKVTIGYGWSGHTVDSIVINDGDAHGNNLSIMTSNQIKTPYFTYRNAVIRSSGKIFNFNLSRKVDLSGISGADSDVSLNMQQVCQYNTALEEFVMRSNGLKISSLYYCFSTCRNARKIDLGGCDLSGCTSVGEFISDARNLTDLTLGDNLKLSLNLSSCISLTHDSLVNGIIAKLGTVSTTQTLQLSNLSKALLSDEEIAVATGKGWTVT